jgi:hypothetical protein
MTNSADQTKADAKAALDAAREAEGAATDAYRNAYTKKPPNEVEVANRLAELEEARRNFDKARKTYRTAAENAHVVARDAEGLALAHYNCALNDHGHDETAEPVRAAKQLYDEARAARDQALRDAT